MSEQPAMRDRTRGGNKATQAAAGIAGALALLGIGWTMGARAASQPVTSSATTLPTTGAPSLPIVSIPGEWGDDDGSQGQWGTITLPGTGLPPAQPGTGGLAPPTTGSGGSSVAGASVTATNVTTTTGTPSSVGGAP